MADAMSRQMSQQLIDRMARPADGPMVSAPVDAASAEAEEPACDCCNDLETFAKTGKVCKAEQECQVQPASLDLPRATADRADIASTDAYRVQTGALAPAGWPATVWRPPNLH